MFECWCAHGCSQEEGSGGGCLSMREACTHNVDWCGRPRCERIADGPGFYRVCRICPVGPVGGRRGRVFSHLSSWARPGPAGQSLSHLSHWARPGFLVYRVHAHQQHKPAEVSGCGKQKKPPVLAPLSVVPLSFSVLSLPQAVVVVRMYLPRF